MVASIDPNTAALALRRGLGVEVELNGQVIKLLPEEVEISAVPKQGYSMVQEDGITVGVNTMITENLRKEGLARDIVRRIQSQRKEAGFNIADHIETYYEAAPKIAETLTDFGDYIAAETLSVRMHKARPPEGAHVVKYKIEGEDLRIGIIKIS